VSPPHPRAGWHQALRGPRAAGFFVVFIATVFLADCFLAVFFFDNWWTSAFSPRETLARWTDSVRAASRRTGELAFYRCYSAARAPLSTLVRVAGRRWTVEETFQFRQGPGRAGRTPGQALDLLAPLGTLAMLAHAVLTVVRADEHARYPKPDGLIPLTCNEIQRLFTALVIRPVHGTAHRLDWSHWRRPHQARPQASHYRRKATRHEDRDLQREYWPTAWFTWFAPVWVEVNPIGVGVSHRCLPRSRRS